MAIRDFALHPATSSRTPDPLRPVPLAATAKLNPNSASPARPIRKAKNLVNLQDRCGWYEAEDRTLPSVSSF